MCSNSGGSRPSVFYIGERQNDLHLMPQVLCCNRSVSHKSGVVILLGQDSGYFVGWTVWSFRVSTLFRSVSYQKNFWNGPKMRCIYRWLLFHLITKAYIQNETSNFWKCSNAVLSHMYQSLKPFESMKQKKSLMLRNEASSPRRQACPPLTWINAQWTNNAL